MMTSHPPPIYSQRTPRHRREIPKAYPKSRWKENLRRSCLENARQKRREQVQRKRLSASSESLEDVLSAKHVVIQECKKHGVGIMSSCLEFGDESNREELSPMEVVETSPLDDFEDHALSEEDIYDILREVEEELRMEEEFLLEEILEADRDCVQDQVDEYESWENDMIPDDQVPCPICHSCYLQISREGPDAMITCRDEYCSVQRIRAHQVENPLLFLRDELGTLHELHASQCPSIVRFTVRTNTQGCVLLASCEDCQFCHELP